MWQQLETGKKHFLKLRQQAFRHWQSASLRTVQGNMLAVKYPHVGNETEQYF